MLIGAILLYGTAVYGEEAFSPEKAFGSYYSYERLDPADNLDKGCYIVSNSNEINSKALFLKDVQMIGFKYNSIKKTSKKYAVVSRMNDGIECFGILNIESLEEILSPEYTAVEYGDSASPYEIDTSYYVVSKGTGDNNKALFAQGAFVTDFEYNSIVKNGYTTIVSKKTENGIKYGMISNSAGNDILLPLEYASIEPCGELFYYIVSKENKDNGKALFRTEKPLTDYIYDSIDVNSSTVVVGQKTEKGMLYGLLDKDTLEQILPVEYSHIDKYDENNDIKDEYVIAKGNGINNNAIYKDNEFKTGFIYDTIDKYGKVSYKTEAGKVYYGLIDMNNYEIILPEEYTSMEDVEGGYMLSQTDGENSKAFYDYSGKKILTDHIYESCEKHGTVLLVGRKTEAGMLYGLIRCSDGVQLLPIEYTSMEFDSTLYHRFCKAVKADGSEYHYIFDENEVMTNAASDEGFESLVERYEDEDNARYTKEESESWASVIRAEMEAM